MPDVISDTNGKLCVGSYHMWRLLSNPDNYSLKFVWGGGATGSNSELGPNLVTSKKERWGFSIVDLFNFPFQATN